MKLTAETFIRRLKGSSQPLLLRCSDKRFYVTKFQGNPQGNHVLANELLGSRLGTKIGIPVAPSFVIEVSDSFLSQSPEISFKSPQGQSPIAEGLHCGSRYVINPAVGSTYDYLPATMLDRVADLNPFAGALAFHLWVQNHGNPQPVFWRPSIRHLYRVTFIDHGLCFGGPNWHWHLGRGQGTALYFHRAVYREIDGWSSFEPFLRAIENIRLEELQALAEGIPECWCGDSVQLDQMLQRLFARKLLVRDLITACVAAHPEHFPLWRRLPRSPSCSETTALDSLAEVTA